MKPVQGYYRQPSIHGDNVVFVSEDDLWTVSANGGTARRLTSGVGTASFPCYSPDGAWIAFTCREEGPPETYIIPAEGGMPRRLTFLGSISRVVGWKDSKTVLAASTYGNFTQRETRILEIDIENPVPRVLPIGPASSITFGGKGGCAIGRNAVDPARWKRYRGGTAGDILVDPTGSGSFGKLSQLKGNIAFPMWIGKRIFFLSDFEGVGNIYSCTPSGGQVKRHTHHEDYYARFPSTDGRRIIFQAGADLYVLNPETDQDHRIDIRFHSSRTQLGRKFPDAAHHLEDFIIHPLGHLLGLVTRGRMFTMGNWHGPVQKYGDEECARYRLGRWLPDGKRLVLLSDAEGEECLEIHHLDGEKPPVKFPRMDFGRATEIKPVPHSEKILLSNHRCELILVDLKTRKTKVLHRNELSPIYGFDVSPDGKWVAFHATLTNHTSVIKMADLEKGTVHQVTKPVRMDFSPAFDPDGKYLYFLSVRDFDPVYDSLLLDLGFPKIIKPCLLTLAKDTPSPFHPVPKPAEEPKKPEAKDGKDKVAARKAEASKGPAKIRIDFEGIQDRLQVFPVPAGKFQQIAGIKGKVLYSSLPVEGALNRDWLPGTPSAKAVLESFDFETQKSEVLVNGISEFTLSPNAQFMVYRAGRRLRVVKAGEKPDEAQSKEPPSKKSGWIDLSRVRFSVLPAVEWKQIFREAWRLQRDHFWSENMSSVDWNAVFDRYFPLLKRLGTRGEFSDLVWEMQGELGTSHCYEFGGDYRPEPNFPIGFLGADLDWNASLKAWVFKRIVRGDPWDPDRTSPLNEPGLNVSEGDTLLAIDGNTLSAQTFPYESLVNLGKCEIRLTVGDRTGKKPRRITVKTLAAETPGRYRDWVEKNREHVHQKTGGKIGYVHVPDMGAFGFSEFHRYYTAECDREGLIVDVRYNGGGHVSPLILEKLARRRIAFVQSRWFGVEPYPYESVGGPIVALTNEHAGSDGDIFSHCFKLMKIGPLIGKRTWGGVVGIWPRAAFVDGSITSQPEFSFWFKDVGWGVENYGTDPDIEIENLPQDYSSGRDSQLERSIAEALRLLKANPPLSPDLGKDRPRLPLPRIKRVK